jgi:hypothetical protein
VSTGSEVTIAGRTFTLGTVYEPAPHDHPAGLVNWSRSSGGMSVCGAGSVSRQASASALSSASRARWWGAAQRSRSADCEIILEERRQEVARRR